MDFFQQFFIGGFGEIWLREASHIFSETRNKGGFSGHFFLGGGVLSNQENLGDLGSE